MNSKFITNVCLATERVRVMNDCGCGCLCGCVRLKWVFAVIAVNGGWLTGFMLSVETALHIPVCVSFTRSNTLFSLKSNSYLCCVLYFFYTREFLW